MKNAIVALTVVMVGVLACSGKKVNVIPEDAIELNEQLDGQAEADSGVPKCQPVSQGVLLAPDSGTTRFALSLFHYNVQYVAGGLEGFTGNPDIDLTMEEVQDAIIVESFVPILGILESHPTWAMDVEMQGYMVDLMAARHPAELERMKALVQTGQMHVNSFHYSDQLWTAYPLPSMEQSMARNSAAFDNVCLPYGGAVFTQEGQFGHGLVRMLEESGRIALYPTNLFKYYSGSDHAGALMFKWDEVPVVIAGKGVKETVGDTEVEVTWHFMNDGELAFTDNLNPYFGSLFLYNEKTTQEYVAKLEQMEAEGWTIASVADYVAHLDHLGYEAPEQPLALDGTWQPKDTQNLFRWMGQVGETGGPVEHDNLVLTTNYKSRILLQAAKVAAQVAKVPDADYESLLYDGWTHQLLGEVSDSSGWNPWLGEVNYSLNHAAEAAAAAYIVGDLATSGGALAVDTGTGDSAANGYEESIFYSASATDGLVLEVLTEDGDEPFVVAAEGTGWNMAAEWQVTGGPGQYLLTITGTPEENATRTITVTFPRFGDELQYVPALLEKEGTVTTFSIHDLALDSAGYLGIGLANGLLGLGQNKWLVKAATTVHLAALIPVDEAVVRFETQSQPPEEAVKWLFFFLSDTTAEEAVAFANKVNVYPIVRFEVL